MKRVCAKFVLRMLTDDQCEQCQKIASDLLEHSCEDEQFCKNIVTGDKSWVYRYDPETKQQTSQWEGPSSPQSKNGHQVRCKTKVMLLAFFYSEGIVHHEYAPNGQTINKEFYQEVLRCLRESVRQKQPEKWLDGDWILYHDRYVDIWVSAWVVYKALLNNIKWYYFKHGQQDMPFFKLLVA